MIKILKTAIVKSSKGVTSHRVGDDSISNIYSVSISQYDEDDGFYLLYLDENGIEITDTYHNSLNDAVSQAEFEFHLKNWDDCV